MTGNHSVPSLPLFSLHSSSTQQTDQFPFLGFASFFFLYCLCCLFLPAAINKLLTDITAEPPIPPCLFSFSPFWVLLLLPPNSIIHFQIIIRSTHLFFFLFRESKSKSTDMSCFLSIFKGRKTRSRSTRLASEPRDNQSTRSISSNRSVQDMYREKEHNLRVFSLTELKEATNGFNRSQKIGEGGFGSVYKGTISPPNGRGNPSLVAIKKLNTQGLQGHKQWLAEIQVLGIVDHPNLVKLLGYCSEEAERGMQLLLVYEYMPNKSLEYHLFSKIGKGPVLSWLSRLQIMLNVARGLSYLHDGLEIQVIYRDFKPSNILLDEDFNPKLSDFGLAREGPAAGVSHVSTAVAGTFGYAAPEYLDTGHLKAESDTYGFGVVLYEILTGRRAIERNRPLKEQKLLEWVKLYPANSKSFTMIIDPRIRSSYSLPAARRIARLADVCLNKNPRDRPTMNEVIEILSQAIQES